MRRNVSVSLCTDFDNGANGTPARPVTGANLNGGIVACGGVGPAGEGLSGGDFDAQVGTMRRGVTDVNVHSIVRTLRVRVAPRLPLSGWNKISRRVL